MWKDRIVAALARSAAGGMPFTPADVSAANSWESCAMSEQPAAVRGSKSRRQRDGQLRGGIHDAVLDRLGMDFMRRVQGQQPLAALRLLKAIEARAIVLYARLGKF